MSENYRKKCEKEPMKVGSTSLLKTNETIDIEDLVTLNEMIKNVQGKETTYQRMKRKKACSSMRAFATFDSYNEQDEQLETLLDKGYEPEKILGVTTIDNLGLFICYLIRYKEGQMELVPNKIVHRYCPQMLIEFLESRLIFSNESYSNLSADIFKGIVDNNNNDRNSEADDTEDEDNDVYVFDELAKCLNLNDFKHMIQLDSKDDVSLDYDHIGDGSSSQIHKLNVLQGNLTNIQTECTADSKNESIVEINRDQLMQLEQEETNYMDDIFDTDVIDELDDLNDLDIHEGKQPKMIHLNGTPGLYEINHTLSLSQQEHFKEKNKNNQSKGINDCQLELSSISPDVLDKLIMGTSTPENIKYFHHNEDELDTEENTSSKDLSEVPETQIYNRQHNLLMSDDCEESSQMDQIDESSFEI